MASSSINAVFDRIEFGVLSVEEIRQMAVAEINNTKLHGPNSVYDERMGSTIITKDKCVTCGLTAKLCTGHFGYIKLAHPIFHPLYEKEILKLLKMFCFSCARLIQADDAISDAPLRTLKKLDRVIDKSSICPYCNLRQPVWEFDEQTSNDAISSVFMTFEDTRVECTTYDVLSLFERYLPGDLVRLNCLTSPVNLVIQLLPVLPPSTRPIVMLDDKYCDDDLTIQYIEIIKVNNVIQTKKDASTPLNEIDKYIKVLYFRIASLFNNSSGKSKHNTNGKAIKGIKERLATKNGLMRENLMGKRVEQSARTVIGPEPTLCMNELAIPVEFAQTLTISERVTAFNRDALTQLVHDQQAKFVRKRLEARDPHTPPEYSEINLQYALKKRGTRLMNQDIVIREGREIPYDPKLSLQANDYIIRDGELFRVTLDANRTLQLEIGDIVDRCLRDGDMVILNRQPTLHAGSMIAQRVRILPGKTLRFNLCITKSLNADFDGDEGNIHVPQQPNAIVELQQLSSVHNHILSQQSGNANTVLVQDNLLSLYLMTYEDTRMDRDEFFDLCMHLVDIQGRPCTLSDIQHKIDHLHIDPHQGVSGPEVLSLCFPDTFTFEEDTVRIHAGKWLAGHFTKKIMAKIIKTVYHVYGTDVVMQLINNFTFISNQWLHARAFSIGLEDCLSSSKQTLIPETIMRCFTEANSLQSQIYHEGIKEVRVQGSLNKARDVGMRIAKEGLHPKNNFLSTVHSGSKGDFFNIAQIAGLLGQQNFRGRRVNNLLNHGDRSLYHYDWTLKEDKDIYESRGFIRHSFLRGLNPREQYFHAVSGREGITDTALGTGETGYMQRRIIKLMEDMHVANDGTIRDDCNKIYQFYYGRHGFDTLGVPRIRDLAEEINTRVELGQSVGGVTGDTMDSA
jgi:DNA-directed RNA polymerase beta' subunit